VVAASIEAADWKTNEATNIHALKAACCSSGDFLSKPIHGKYAKAPRIGIAQTQPVGSTPCASESAAGNNHTLVLATIHVVSPDTTIANLYNIWKHGNSACLAGQLQADANMADRSTGLNNPILYFMLVEALEQLFEVFPYFHAASSISFPKRQSYPRGSWTTRNAGPVYPGNPRYF
jgi:hypothetical protein